MSEIKTPPPVRMEIKRHFAESDDVLTSPSKNQKRTAEVATALNQLLETVRRPYSVRDYEMVERLFAGPGFRIVIERYPE